MAAQALRVQAFAELFVAVANTVSGILRGAGDTKFSSVMSMVGMWGVRILFTYLCVHVWKLGLIAVWNCMIASNVAKAVLLFILLLVEDHKLFQGKGLEHDTV